MIDPKGVAVAFSVPMVVAKPFLEGLQRRMGELEEEMRKAKSGGGVP